jgi:hypothetical protein
VRSSRNLVLFLLLAASATSLLNAEDPLSTITGTCSVAAAENPNEFELKLHTGKCVDGENCNNNQTNISLDRLTGISLDDLKHEGSHIDAAIHAEAGQLTCSGTVHAQTLSGDYRFVPDALFVSHMHQMGFTDLDSRKLQAYTLFRIDTAWIHSLQTDGVEGVDSGNLIALRIFRVDTAYINSLKALGYSVPDAGKLIALRVQNVDPEEVKKIRAMGYQPTLDELIQMRIFQVTPDFIHRMQARGLNDLTIAKLVQIRIFKLAD